MRLLLLPLLLTLAAAQDPRIAKAPSPAQVQFPFSAPETSPAPVASSIPQRLFASGKRIFDAAILGKIPQEDTELRDERDKTDGVERLMKENWDKVTEGPANDVWVMLISGPPRDYIDFRFLDTHKNATRLTREHIAKDEGMIKYRFARVDYMREVEICTRWLIFSSPVLAFVSDQGRTIRWAPKGVVGAGGDLLFDILKSGQWNSLPVWESRYAPGGDRAYLVDFYLHSSDFVSEQMSKVPNLVWMGLFAALTQALVKWLHAPSAPQPTTKGPRSTPAVVKK